MTHDNLFGHDLSADPLKALDKPRSNPAALRPPAAKPSGSRPAELLVPHPRPAAPPDLSPKPGDSSADTVLDELVAGEADGGNKHTNLFDGI